MIPESRDRPPECSRSSAPPSPYHLQARPAHLVASGIALRLPDARTREDLLPRRRERIRTPPPQADAGGRRRVRAKGRFRPATSVRSSRAGGCRRSEEHTSELQSRENLVCRLLLEKKKSQIVRSTTPAAPDIPVLRHTNARAHSDPAARHGHPALTTRQTHPDASRRAPGPHRAVRL